MSPFLRPNIRAMTGYTPGEQPRDGAFIKLNTNENPYPPSPRVFEAIRAALRSEEHTSELQSLTNLVCRLLLEKKKPPSSGGSFGIKQDDFSYIVILAAVSSTT